MKPEQVNLIVTFPDHVEMLGVITTGLFGGTEASADFTKVWTHLGNGWWRREPTDENLAAEVKQAYKGTAIGWRRMKGEERPTLADGSIDRTNRAAWEDNGKKLAVNPARVQEKIKSKTELLEERVAALEARRG